MADWNASFEADPAGSKNPTLGDDDIRSLKLEIRYGLDHETAWFGTTRTLRGVARNGSAKAYYQTTAPTTKPNVSDGALDTTDRGRFWVDSATGNTYVYDHTSAAFVRINRGVQCLTSNPAAPIQGEEWIRTDQV